jgi:hypothetical protein
MKICLFVVKKNKTEIEEYVSSISALKNVIIENINLMTLPLMDALFADFIHYISNNNSVHSPK